ncbi:MAG: YqgE/AlgH family protein [Gammaproteobacteria bacterium]
MNDLTSLQNQFLIATPGMGDPYFQKCVVYICEHNERGAMGIIINQPMSITLADLLKHMEILPQDAELSNLPAYLQQAIFAGGPLQRERGFVLHSPPGQWQSSFVMESDITVTTSRDILQALVEPSEGKEPPEALLVALGYANWEPGQLEEELIQNSWLTSAIDKSILFNTPAEQRWQASGRLLGVDLLSLPSVFGHA